MRAEFWWRSDVEPLIWHRVEPVFIDSGFRYSGQTVHEVSIGMQEGVVWRRACCDDEWWSKGTMPEGVWPEPDLSRPVCPWCVLPDGADPIHAQLTGLRFAEDHDIDFDEVGAFVVTAVLSTPPPWWPEPTNITDWPGSRPPRWSYDDDTAQRNEIIRLCVFQRDILVGRRRRRHGSTM